MRFLFRLRRKETTLDHLSRIKYTEQKGWAQCNHANLCNPHAHEQCLLNTCVRLTGFSGLTGLEMAWVQRPPEKVSNGEEFNVSYTVTASDSFYEYAVKKQIFQFK